MDADLAIQGGMCVLGDGVRPVDIAVAGGLIIEIAPSGGLRSVSTATSTCDATGLVVLPGAVDAHVHVRDPGQTHKEDYLHASRAAAAGGVTAIIAQPNTVPPVEGGAGVHRVVDAGRTACVDHGVFAGVSPDDVDASAIESAAAAGALGFEVLPGSSAPEDAHLDALFGAVARTGLPVSWFATDPEAMSRQLSALRREERIDWRRMDRIVEPEAEARGIRRAVSHARRHGVALLLRQVTTAAGTEVIRAAKERTDTPVFAEVAVHHLFLSTEDAASLGALGYMYPPLRARGDIDHLWREVNSGAVDIVSSDHAPHTMDEKLATKDLGLVPPGVPGLDTLVPFLVSAAIEGRIEWTRLVDVVATRPASVCGLAGRKGSLAVGADADLVLVDTEARWTFQRERVHSKCGWSPFEGRPGRGALRHVLLRGVEVSKDGEPIADGGGLFLRPDGLRWSP